MPIQDGQIFKVSVEFEADYGEPAHPPIIIAVTRNEKIRTASDAVAHCLQPIGKKDDGKPITRIHHKSNGLFFSISKAVAVREEPFSFDEAPIVRSLAGEPKKDGE